MVLPYICLEWNGYCSLKNTLQFQKFAAKIIEQTLKIRKKNQNEGGGKMGKELVQIFKEKAQAVSAIVEDVGSLKEAVGYVVNLCDQKEACQLLLSGCGEPLSADGGALCAEKQPKTIAAPGLDAALTKRFHEKCHASGITFITGGLRDHLAGIDMGFTIADYGIAETGTLVIDSTREDIRLASMISEIHLALLPVKRIVDTADEIADALAAAMAGPSNYTAFITGASRTADIERVLALGVHGPLELHVLLLGEN
jgi:L-lactate dehydrogenase complex protein LldG